MDSLFSFIHGLPKAELHLHLVGAAPPATVLELARRHPSQGVPTDAEELEKLYVFKDFPHFARVHEMVNGLVREPEDLAELVRGVARELADQNVRYAELTVTPYGRALHGMAIPAMTSALDVAARDAASEVGVELAYIFDIWGDHGKAATDVTVEAALEHPPERLVAFGLAGLEQARPPFAEAFRDAFRAAVNAGLHSVPHAGEMTGPETIWTALNDLGAERIGHGITCLADPELVAVLRERQIPLEVSPTSNVCTGQVPSIAEHPFPRLLSEGLYVTVNSDDPPMFGTSLEQEYRVVAQAFGLREQELAELSRRAVRASFASGEVKADLLAEIDAYVGGSSAAP